METQDLTILEQVNELATVSGKPMEFAVQELTKLAEQAKAITTVSDPNFKIVKAEMVSRRNYIKEYCLDARREIKKVAASVSTVEEALYEIFVPEENRLIELAEADKQQKLREEREALLPQRIERINAIWGEGHQHGVTTEMLLEMDGSTFEGLINRMNSEKLETDRAEIARQQAEINRQREEQEKEAKRLEDEKNAREREEIARQEERAKADQRVADEKARMEREAKEKEEREAREKAAAEQLEKDRAEAAAKAEEERKAKLAADKKYQTWLTASGYEAENCILVEKGNEVKMYRLISTFTK